MDSQIIHYLRLSDISKHASIFITKDITSDINFLYGEILPYYLKKSYSIILINFSQSYAHYNYVLSKHGVNVRQLKGNQCFINIDGLSEIESLTNLTQSETDDTSFKGVFSNLQEIECVKHLYFHIKTIVDKIADESKEFLLFIDDIIPLLNLGLSMNAVILFQQYCRSLRKKNGSDIPNILLVGGTHDNNDPENNKLINYLLHLADIRIQVEGLKTGYSKDAHGKITVKIDTEGICNHEKFLFKVTDKGAKLFSFGL